jgi:hypothetical protein
LVDLREDLEPEVGPFDGTRRTDPVEVAAQILGRGDDLARVGGFEKLNSGVGDS